MRYPLILWLLLALSAVLSACYPDDGAMSPSDVKIAVSASEAEHPDIARMFLDAREVALWVCEKCGKTQLVPNPDVKTWAAASWEGTGVVMYNPSQLADVRASHGRTAVLAIIAHEWGHVATRSASQVTADAFAGCVLRVLQEDPQPFIEWLDSVHAWHERDDYMLRAHAVGAGWKRCTDPGEVIDAFDGGAW